MDLGLRDSVALVAGSSRGIGKATAHALLAEGCFTVVTGRDEVALAATTAEFAAEFGADRLLALPGDWTDRGVIQAGLKAIQSRWRRLDCVVANIGSGRGKVGWELSDQDWNDLLETNLGSAFRLLTEVLPVMARAGSAGSIVVVSSIVGVESTPAPLAYSAAKAALVNLSKNLARQAGPLGVRVNCVAPGNVLFPGGSWERHLAARRAEVEQYIAAEVALRRFGKPEEIADVIAFLCSDRAAFLTGACVVVDGGQTRGY